LVFKKIFNLKKSHQTSGSIPRAKVFPGLTKIINTQNNNLLIKNKPKIQQPIKQQELNVYPPKNLKPQNKLREIKMPPRNFQGNNQNFKNKKKF
jgi:hypothetical protein